MVVLKKQKISNKVKASGSKKLKSDAIADNKSVESTSKKSGKVISANDLKWNNVKISKSVDVVEGFFGLEEIEGVDVKYIDGKAQFVVKDTSKLRNNSEKEVKSKKNFSLLTEEEEEELDREEEERQQAGSSGNYEEEEEDDDDDDEDHDKDNEDDDDEFTGFSDASEDESEGEAPQVTSLLNDVDNDERNDDDLDEDLLADYKENMSSNKLTNIIDENDEINNVTLDSDFIDNWSDMSLSKYSLNALSKLNFTKPTLVQKECIPIGIKNFDIIGKASTGSGKTLAYGLPILERFLLRLKENQNQALTTPIGVIFTPTRELAKQVYNHLLKIVEHYPIKNPKTLIVSITGGLSIQKQERLLSYNPGIVIATPGRFLELIELNNNDILNRLSSIEMLTLDEADRLLQDGHFGELEKIIEVLGKIRLQNHKRTKWQTLVFSATFSKALFHKLDKNVKKVAEKKNTSKKTKGKSKGKGGKGGKKFEEEESLTDDTEIIEFLKAKLQFKDKYPKLVNVNPKEIVSGSVSEALIECDATNRDLYLYYFLILYTGSTLIFTNSIDSVKRLNSFLKFLKIKAFCIHSSMLQKQRLRNLENFQKSCTLAAAASGTNKRKETVVLIATDVAARGLDIPSIDHVVHYHLPRSADLYIHRSGRTGRAGKEGVSIMLCSPQEAGGPLRRLRKLILDESIKMKKKQLEKQMAGMEDRKEAERQIAAKVEAMNDDVKLLPIQVSILDQLRERSEIAGELAESEVNKSSLSKEDSWASKVAKDLEIDDLSDFEDDVLTKNRNKKLNKQLDQKKIQGKKYQLNQLLQQRLKFGGSGGSGKYLSNGLVNMADVMLKGTGHGNIIGYDSVDVIDVIKKSQKHQERLLKLAEQKKAQKEQIEERKQIRNKKKDAKKNNKRKREELKEEQISGGEPREGFYDDDNDEFSDDE